MGVTAHRARAVFDGTALHDGACLVVDGGHVTGLALDAPAGAEVRDHGDALLAPGFVDLQVNGGGGVMLNDAADADGLRRIAAAHLRLGTTTLLPTLITDRPEVTEAAVAAAVDAVRAGVPGIAGLHLEGPHLDPDRAGAHDPALIRPMTARDLAFLCDAAKALPVLKVTVAPEAVSLAQIATLAEAGALVSLGHSGCTYETALAAVEAGARCVTHLFNAMSPLAHRAPGLAGAALAEGRLAVGLIADGVHVHDAALGIALRAKAGPERLFLVTDAMAVAGTDLASFTLNGRTILRRDGQLVLADGTLAGADLDMAAAVARVARLTGDPAAALAMAISIPAGVAGLAAGRLAPGAAADFVALGPDWALRGVWQGERRVAE